MRPCPGLVLRGFCRRSEEHTSELQSPCISYAVFCLKKKNLTNRIGARVVAVTVTPVDHPVRVAVRVVDLPVATGVTRVTPTLMMGVAFFFFFNDRATPEIYPFPPPDPLPI